MVPVSTSTSPCETEICRGVGMANLRWTTGRYHGGAGRCMMAPHDPGNWSTQGVRRPGRGRWGRPGRARRTDVRTAGTERGGEDDDDPHARRAAAARRGERGGRRGGGAGAGGGPGEDRRGAAGAGDLPRAHGRGEPGVLR